MLTCKPQGLRLACDQHCGNTKSDISLYYMDLFFPEATKKDVVIPVYEVGEAVYIQL